MPTPQTIRYPRVHYCGLYGVQLPNLDWWDNGGAACLSGTKITLDIALLFEDDFFRLDLVTHFITNNKVTLCYIVCHSVCVVG